MTISRAHREPANSTRMKPIETFESPVVVLPVDDVDTDQIIPARFLKGTDREGLGDALFADWRYDATGAPIEDFILNHPASREARVLLAGHNFGCGSSREHAPWALVAYGFRAVVSTDFADIFRNNSLKNGLLPITVSEEAHRRMREIFDSGGGGRVRVDLAAQTLTLPDGETVGFPIDPFAKHCLLHGVDQLGFLLAASDAIAAYESEHAPAVDTLAAHPGRAS
jgi:3-isopropylmalate/(R)-2-methylmalate dehydratase small subunit